MAKVEDAYNLLSVFKDFCDYLNSVDELFYAECEPHLGILQRKLQELFEKSAAEWYENTREE